MLQSLDFGGPVWRHVYGFAHVMFAALMIVRPWPCPSHFAEPHAFSTRLWHKLHCGCMVGAPHLGHVWQGQRLPARLLQQASSSRLQLCQAAAAMLKPPAQNGGLTGVRRFAEQGDGDDGGAGRRAGGEPGPGAATRHPVGRWVHGRAAAVRRWHGRPPGGGQRRWRVPALCRCAAFPLLCHFVNYELHSVMTEPLLLLKIALWGDSHGCQGAQGSGSWCDGEALLCDNHECS